MKNRYLYTAIAFIITITTVSAQRMQYKGNHYSKNKTETFCQIADLSEEQQESIKAERVKFYNATLDDKNVLRELIAKKRTLETTEPIDEKGLNKILNEMNQLKTNLAKKQVRHKQTIKSYLNEEQLLAFEQNLDDARGYKGKKGQGKPHYKMNIKACNTEGNNGLRAEKRGKYEGRRNDRHSANTNILSDDLKEELEASRLELMKQQQPLNNQLNELKAEFKTLTYGQSIDLKKVDKNIDKQAQLKLKIAVLHNEHRLEIRSKLTDEQKIWFDKHAGHKRRMN